MNILPAEAGVKIGPGKDGVPPNPPKGYGKIVHENTTLQKTAVELLKEDYGKRTTFTVGPYSYMARVEPHPPRAGMREWHKGVTVYEKLGQDTNWGLTAALFALGATLAYTAKRAFL